jgi:hypothetical protein
VNKNKWWSTIFAYLSNWYNLNSDVIRYDTYKRKTASLVCVHSLVYDRYLAKRFDVVSTRKLEQHAISSPRAGGETTSLPLPFLVRSSMPLFTPSTWLTNLLCCCLLGQGKDDRHWSLLLHQTIFGPRKGRLKSGKRVALLPPPDHIYLDRRRRFRTHAWESLTIFCWDVVMNDSNTCHTRKLTTTCELILLFVSTISCDGCWRSPALFSQQEYVSKNWSEFLMFFLYQRHI